MKICGFRSVNGNHELCTCTMIRCPRLKTWFTSCMAKLMESTCPGTNASGFSNPCRYFPRNGSPRTNCWNPDISTSGTPTSFFGGPFSSPFGAKSGGYTSINFTSKSESVPLVETNNFGDTGPATVTSSSSGAVW